MTNRKQIFVHVGNRRWITIEMDAAEVDELWRIKNEAASYGEDIQIQLSRVVNGERVMIPYKDLFADRKDITIGWSRERGA